MGGWGSKVSSVQTLPSVLERQSEKGSLPGSSVHGISQAGILKWVAISFSRGSSQPRDQTQVSCIAGKFFTNCTIREDEKGAINPLINQFRYSNPGGRALLWRTGMGCYLFFHTWLRKGLWAVLQGQIVSVQATGRHLTLLFSLLRGEGRSIQVSGTLPTRSQA